MTLNHTHYFVPEKLCKTLTFSNIDAIYSMINRGIPCDHPKLSQQLFCVKLHEDTYLKEMERSKAANKPY